MDTPTKTATLLAALADVDPRTASRALRGERVRGRVGERISAVLLARPELLPKTAADVTLNEPTTSPLDGESKAPGA